MRPFTLHSLSACLATKSLSTGAEGDTSHRAQASLAFEGADFRWNYHQRPSRSELGKKRAML